MLIRPDARLAFLRFRDTGDPAALAEVFDLVAQQLLLVASHVAGKQQQPEDLLQETFLKAIERADRYDAERPLEPWLVGILVNVTRNDRRRRQREVPSDVIEPTPTLRQPSDAVIEAEFVAALHEAIGTLPVPQREVMTLNLVHGMTPTQIAHATSRPVGTVKSWIHRSLAVLRRQLPASMALAFGALLRGMANLTLVREAVVAAGARHAAAAAAGATTSASGVAADTTPGILWLRWGLAAAGAAVLAMVVTWLQWPHAVEPPLPTVDDQRTVAGAEVTDDTTDTAADIAAREQPPALPASPPTGTVHFVGDFAGDPFAWQGYVAVPTLPDAFLSAVPLNTGESGRHTMAGMPYGLYQLQPNRGRDLLFVVDSPEQTVVVPMRDGVHVHGRVVDSRGVGVAGASIFATFTNSFELRLPIAETDQHGQFELPEATRGSYLEARIEGWRSSGLRQVPLDGPAEPLELQLGLAAGTIGVEVVDARGTPVVGALLQLGSALAGAFPRENGKTRSMRLPWVGRTDQRGLASCREVATDRRELLFVRAPGLAPTVVPIEPQQLGTTVHVELADGATCSGQLQRSDGIGCPGMARAVGLDAEIGQRPPTWYWPTCVAHADGGFELTGLPAGEVLLQARDRVGGQAEREVQVSAGEQVTWSPRFGAGPALRGTVLDDSDQPFREAVVCARAVGCQPFHAAIDELGRFVFENLPDRRFELLVQHSEQPDALVLQRHFGARPGDEITLRLPRDRRPTAVLRGRLARPEERVGVLQRASGKGCFAKVDDEGRFEVAMPPGDYHVLAGVQRVWLRHDVTLADGEVRDLGMLDGGESCRLRLLVPSVATRGAAQVLAYTDEIGPMFGMARVAEPVGEMTLPAGSYRLLLVQDGAFVAQQLVSIAPDRDNEVTFERIEAGATLTAFARPRTPRVDLRVLWQVDGNDGTRRYVTVREPNQRSDRPVGLQVVLPPGDYTVTARVADGEPVTMPVTVPMSGDLPLHLQLP